MSEEGPKVTEKAKIVLPTLVQVSEALSNLLVEGSPTAMIQLHVKDSFGWLKSIYINDDHTTITFSDKGRPKR